MIINNRTQGFSNGTIKLSVGISDRRHGIFGH